MSASSTNWTPTISPASTSTAEQYGRAGVHPGGIRDRGQQRCEPNIVLFTDNNLSPGQDFAIRVQEFKANFKGNLTENLKWRLNVFGIDKEGDRQVNEFQHCSAAAGNGSTLPVALACRGGSSGVRRATTDYLHGRHLTSQCHVTSQSQHIDWQTTEVTPSLELRLDCDTMLEYSHLIRAFTANDQM